VDDYVFLINNALKAAGFLVYGIVTTHTHFPDGPAEEMVESSHKSKNEHHFGLTLKPRHQGGAYRGFGTVGAGKK
jgi:hypothetical protein